MPVPGHDAENRPILNRAAVKLALFAGLIQVGVTIVFGTVKLKPIYVYAHRHRCMARRNSAFLLQRQHEAAAFFARRRNRITRRDFHGTWRNNYDSRLCFIGGDSDHCQQI